MKETYSRTKSVWQRMNQKERKAVMDYGEKYKAFLDTARTERLAAAEIIRQAEEKGFGIHAGLLRKTCNINENWGKRSGRCPHRNQYSWPRLKITLPD